MVRTCPGYGRAPQRNGRIPPTAREDQDARSPERHLPQRLGALEARIIRLEADVSALTQDRRWLVELLAGLAVELEKRR